MPPSHLTSDLLPAGIESFTVRKMAALFGTSHQHWINQIECGKLRAVDLRSPGAMKSMYRIPRASLIDYLDKHLA